MLTRSGVDVIIHSMLKISLLHKNIKIHYNSSLLQVYARSKVWIMDKKSISV